jgi:hypothetical protein
VGVGVWTGVGQWQRHADREGKGEDWAKLGEGVVSGGEEFWRRSCEQKFNIEHMPVRFSHVMLKVTLRLEIFFLRLEWTHWCGPSFSHSPVLPAKPNITISLEIK